MRHKRRQRQKKWTRARYFSLRASGFSASNHQNGRLGMLILFKPGSKGKVPRKMAMDACNREKNIEHPTSNIQHPMISFSVGLGCSMFRMGSWGDWTLRPGQRRLVSAARNQLALPKWGRAVPTPGRGERTSRQGGKREESPGQAGNLAENELNDAPLSAFPAEP